MTTPEHTLVGMHAALAVGASRRWGWQVVVLAAVASNLPDWDGLPMLVDMARFEAGHRVWGHNVFCIAATSAVVAWLEWRYHLIDRMAGRLQRFKPADLVVPTPERAPAWWTLFAVVAVVQLLHLVCDMVVSGGQGLSDWQVKPFWPLADLGYVLTLVPWGDVGATVVLMLGAIAAAKWPRHVTRASQCMLVVLVAYLLLRGWMRGVLG